MYAGIRADVRAVFDDHVTRECRRVGHDDAVADETVVRDVGLGHDQAIIAEARDHAATRSAAMNGDKLANLVARADARLRRLAFVFEILRSQTDRNEWENVCPGTDRRAAVDHDVRFKPHLVAENDFVADDAVRTDETLVANFGFGTNNCGRMNRSRMSSGRHNQTESEASRGATMLMISASAASWPSTFASPRMRCTREPMRS